jgi:hypothetical protein
MSETKRQIKCGVCHEVGHNKKTCPTTKTTPEPSNEVSDVKPIVVVTVREFYNDHVHAQTIYPCATAESAARKIAEVLKGILTDELGQEYTSDNASSTFTPNVYKHLFYYTSRETVQFVPNPTEKDIKASLADPKNYDGLFIKIGDDDLEKCDFFGLEICVNEKPLYV